VELDGFTEWLGTLDKRNLLERVYILAGLIPPEECPRGSFYG